MDESRVRYLVKTYADMIVRISAGYVKRSCDAEDICQTVFLKCLTESRVFDSHEQEKAWLIRTTVNACKDYLRNAFIRRTVPLEAAANIPAPDEFPISPLLDALRMLPEKYRISLYLYYYEEYSVREIAETLHTRENTVSAWLSRGRRKLRQYLTACGEGDVKYEG